MATSEMSSWATQQVAGLRKPRIEFIDCLRGFTMILVVYSHVVSLLFDTYSVSNKFFIIFRMPLFFFVSGYFCYSASYTKSLVRRRLWNRLSRQLFPSCVVMSIFLLLFHFSFDAFFSSTKAGYWFTFVAFEYFLTYLAIIGILRLFNAGDKPLLLIVIILSLAAKVALSYLNGRGLLGNRIIGFLSLENYLYNFPYFFIGILARRYWKKMEGILDNGIVMTFAYCVFILLFFNDLSGGGYLIQRILGIFIVFQIFRYYQSYFSSKTLLGKWLSYIGKYTLEIYLLHYIVIFSIMSLRDTELSTIVDQSWLLQFMAYFILSIIILGICLLLSSVFKIAPPLYQILFGRPEK